MNEWTPISTRINFTRPQKISGLAMSEMETLNELFDIYECHMAGNIQKNKYYEGNISLADVNLGIALPNGIANLSIGCAWGSKAVDVLAVRSIFDGFVGENGQNSEILDEVVKDNNLIAEYFKACRDELKYGCTFATLSADNRSGCSIRFHSPMTAAAKWSGEKGRIECGFAIIETKKKELQRIPTIINLYTENAIWVLELDDQTDIWHATGYLHKMGRPLMEPLVWNATSNKPLGRSRLKHPIRELIKGYVRTVANATIGLEFATAPQKYLLGITDDQFNAVVNNKFKQYVGNILAATTNPETGEKPTFGQLQQGTISPHVEMLRILATQFSAATGLPVTDTGVINDANPTSSDAILAQTKTLVGMAEELNVGNGESLRIIALMAMAIVQNKTIDELTAEEKAVIAHFQNPAMPSVAATTDAAMKIASVRPSFSQTDTFLEMIGFDQADIRRIKNQEKQVRGLNLVSELTDG